MAGFVYLIGSEQFGWYKIGKSKDHHVRLEQLGILLPFKVEVFAIWEAENHSELERISHRMYSENRINGEWFSFSTAERSSVISKISKWDARLIFPQGIIQSKPIRASNIAMNIIKSPEPKERTKRAEKHAAIEAYVAEHGLDRRDKQSMALAYSVVLKRIKEERSAA
jgi:hypothetical protein